MKVRRVDLSPDEWIAGTIELDNAERGLYITACALIYSGGGPVTQDRLKAACRDHGHAFNRQFDRLIALGKLTINDGQISNKRSIKELQKAEERTTKARQNGNKGGRPSKKNNHVAKPDGLRDEKTNHQPSTINHNSVGSDEPTAAAAGAGEVSPAPNVVKMTPSHSREEFEVRTARDPKQRLYEYGKRVFGESGGGIITKLFREADGNIDTVLDLIECCRGKDDPRAYAFGILRRGEVQALIYERSVAAIYAGAL